MRRDPTSRLNRREPDSMTKWVYDFAEGDASQKNLLGGKGANLAEMTNLGLPVPPGFTITTEACNAYREGGQEFPEGLLDEVAEHLKQLEGPWAASWAILATHSSC